MGTPTAEAAWAGWTPKDVKKHKVAVYKLADGTFEAFARVGKLPQGATRCEPQPEFPTSGDPHEGTRVAMKKLEASHPLHIQWGCYAAILIARKNLTVHSRAVWEKLGQLGVVDQSTGPAFWLGAVFKKLKTEGLLRDTGQKYKYSDASRGIHEREVKIWALTENAQTRAYEIGRAHV